MTAAHPSPWAWITHEQVGAELIELVQASDAVLQVAALKFDEQGQQAEEQAERAYCRAMADAVRCLIRAKAAR